MSNPYVSAPLMKAKLHVFKNLDLSSQVLEPEPKDGSFCATKVRRERQSPEPGGPLPTPAALFPTAAFRSRLELAGAPHPHPRPPLLPNVSPSQNLTRTARLTRPVPPPPHCPVVMECNHSQVAVTIGPSCQDVETLTELLQSGMAAARVDLTWGPLSFHRKSLANLQQARAPTVGAAGTAGAVGAVGAAGAAARVCVLGEEGARAALQLRWRRLQLWRALSLCAPHNMSH